MLIFSPLQQLCVPQSDGISSSGLNNLILIQVNTGLQPNEGIFSIHRMELMNS